MNEQSELRVTREWVERYGVCRIFKRTVRVEAFYGKPNKNFRTTVAKVSFVIHVDGREVASDESAFPLPVAGVEGITTQMAIFTRTPGYKHAKWTPVILEFCRRCGNTKTPLGGMRVIEPP